MYFQYILLLVRFFRFRILLLNLKLEVRHRLNLWGFELNLLSDSGNGPQVSSHYVDAKSEPSRTL